MLDDAGIALLRTVTMAYDNRSRVSSVTDVFGQVVSYAYDANSNRTQLSLNAATNATYQYDVINRLTQLTDNASLNTTFAYDPTNKLTSRTLPNGVVTTSQYDGLDRLTRLTHAKAGNTLADFQYQLNAVSSITQMAFPPWFFAGEGLRSVGGRCYRLPYFFHTTLGKVLISRSKITKF
ncbi:MAG: hypothetical protein ACR2G5_16035 [Pyrinomonadaceae bacterium]